AATSRGWESYRSIERYMEARACRRRQILAHFGDDRAGAPAGRCCDVCDLDPGLVAALERAPTRASRSRSARPGEPSAEPVDERQFEALRAWRMERAAGSPAYTVAANAVLEEVLRLRPASLHELIGVRGVGPAFCEKHGESLLSVIRSL